MPKNNDITVNLKTEGLDEIIEKANQLKDTLEEVNKIINSLKEIKINLKV